MQVIKTSFRAILFLIIFVVFASCNGQNQKPGEAKTGPAFGLIIGDTVKGIGKNIDCIFQDKNDNYWFGSNGEGVYWYNGKTLKHITVKHGLCSNFVWKIAEDKNGNLWFTTRDGICNFNGNMFTDYSEIIKNAPQGQLQYVKDGMFFGSCFYDGKTFTNFSICPPGYSPPPYTTYNPYAIYCTLVDKTLKTWFGTQEMGVCVYDGKTFSFINDKNLGGPAVRAIFEDKNGVLWFGNNGGGLFRYDGKTLRNITEEKNLTNYEFLKEKRPVNKEGTLARVFAINEDGEGNIWIGTVDAGLWKYDGVKLTNYSVKDGLSANNVYVIYKDKSGKLWFVANGEDIYNFDGQKFLKHAF